MKEGVKYAEQAVTEEWLPCAGGGDWRVTTGMGFLSGVTTVGLNWLRRQLHSPEHIQRHYIALSNGRLVLQMNYVSIRASLKVNACQH